MGWVFREEEESAKERAGGGKGERGGRGTEGDKKYNFKAMR